MVSNGMTQLNTCIALNKISMQLLLKKSCYNRLCSLNYTYCFVCHLFAVQQLPLRRTAMHESQAQKIFSV